MPTIRTPRLELIPLVPEAIRKLLDGDRNGAAETLGVTLPAEFPAPGELRGFLPIQLERMQAAPQRRGWMARVMAFSEGGVAIGHCGFHGPPEMMSDSHPHADSVPDRRLSVSTQSGLCGIPSGRSRGRWILFGSPSRTIRC